MYKMGYCIYKIVCDDMPDYVYVGSTSNFTNRKCGHKSNCFNINSKKYNYKLYSTIRENGGWDNWRMVIINECEEGITKTQAHIIEEEFRVKLNGNMNSIKCFRTEEEREEYNKVWNENNKELRKEYYKEYIENNKEKMKEYSKEYYKEYSVNNKEKIKEKTKEYRENNKEKTKEYYENNKEKIKEYKKKYQEENKEKLKEYLKEYRVNNKEKIKERVKEYSKEYRERNKEKFTCECGCETSKLNLLRHQKTKKHIKLMETQNQTK